MSLRGKIQHASRRSTLPDWMERNFSWFAQEIEEIYRQHKTPDWAMIAQLLAEHEGVLTKAGGAQKPDAVRMCYRRFQIKQRPVSQPVPLTPPSPPSPPTPAPLPVVQKESAAEPSELAKRFALAQLEMIRGKGPR